jgi:hypothetical protein
MWVSQPPNLGDLGPLACPSKENQKCAVITTVSQLEWHLPDARDAIQVSLTPTISIPCEVLPSRTSKPVLVVVSGDYCSEILQETFLSLARSAQKPIFSSKSFCWYMGDAQRLP